MTDKELADHSKKFDNYFNGRLIPKDFIDPVDDDEEQEEIEGMRYNEKDRTPRYNYRPLEKEYQKEDE